MQERGLIEAVFGIGIPSLDSLIYVCLNLILPVTVVPAFRSNQ